MQRRVMRSATITDLGVRGRATLTLPDQPGANMSDVERTLAGMQMVIPGCERPTLLRSTTRVDDAGQGLLGFYKPPSLRERLAVRADALLRASRGQKALPKGGLFGG